MFTGDESFTVFDREILLHTGQERGTHLKFVLNYEGKRSSVKELCIAKHKMLKDRKVATAAA